jgi:ribose 5-phosphate isomerase B
MPKKVLTERDVLDAIRKGVKSLPLEPGTLLTPSARDAAVQYGVELSEQIASSTGTKLGVTPEKHSPKDKNSPNASTLISLGSDHGGFQLKNVLKQYLLELGYTVLDVGTHSEEACDYPDFAYAVATMVARGDAQKGIIIDGVGVASAIVANKVPGIRAVPCSTEFVARSSREHNDANVLTLGGRVLGQEAAKAIVKVWLETWFGGGRHQQRVQKISQIEEKFSRK